MSTLVVVARSLRGAERLAARHRLDPDRWIWCSSYDIAVAWCAAADDRDVPLSIWQEPCEPSVAVRVPAPVAPRAPLATAVTPAAARPTLAARLAERRSMREAVASCS